MRNTFFTGFIRLLGLVPCILVAGCARSAVSVQYVEISLPAHSSAAVLGAREGAWLAWGGDLSAPDLYVQRVGAVEAQRLPISSAPTDIRLLALAERRMALLWLERSAGGPALQAATLEPEGNLRRAPFEIGAAQRYIALPTPTGGVLALTIQEGVLVINQLDRLGRPYGRVRAAESAHMAAAALDGRDRLHLLWLAPGDGELWQLLYLSIQLALLDESAPRLPAPTLLAVLRLAEGEYVESLSAAADAEHLYTVWNIVRVSHEGAAGRLDGIVLQQEAPLRSRQLDLSALPANLREVSLPFADDGQGSAVTLVGRSRERWIVFGALTARGVFRVQQFEGATADQTLSGGVAASLSANNALHLAWLVQDRQGRAKLRYAAFPRPQPALAPS